MEKIPTAKDMVDKWQDIALNNIKSEIQDDNSLENTLIEFAKMHVEAALKAASEKAFAQSSRSNFTSKDRQLYGKQGLICVHLGDVSVNEDSILNSYSLDNIK